MWMGSLEKAERPSVTKEQAIVIDKILALLSEQGMTYMEAGDFLFQVIKELEYRFSKATLG